MNMILGFFFFWISDLGLWRFRALGNLFFFFFFYWATDWALKWHGLGRARGARRGRSGAQKKNPFIKRDGLGFPRQTHDRVRA